MAMPFRKLGKLAKLAELAKFDRKSPKPPSTAIQRRWYIYFIAKNWTNSSIQFCKSHWFYIFFGSNFDNTQIFLNFGYFCGIYEKFWNTGYTFGFGRNCIWNFNRIGSYFDNFIGYLDYLENRYIEKTVGWC